MTSFEGPIDLAAVVLMLQALTFIELALTSCNGDLQLGQAFFVDKKLQRHEGMTFFLKFLVNLADLRSIQQKFTLAVYLMIGVAAMGVFLDAHLPNEDLTITHRAKGFGQIDLAVANTLDLGSTQHDPRREFFQDLEFEARFSIDDMYLILGHFTGPQNYPIPLAIS